MIKKREHDLTLRLSKQTRRRKRKNTKTPNKELIENFNFSRFKPNTSSLEKGTKRYKCLNPHCNQEIRIKPEPFLECPCCGGNELVLYDIWLENKIKLEESDEEDEYEDRIPIFVFCAQ